MDILGFATLVIVGFTACAEFGSYAFVQPVIRRLPPQHHIAVEKGMLHTFGRVMPVLMPASLVLAIVHALASGDAGGPALWRWLAVAALGLAVATTLVVNVPINIATGKWNPDDPPSDWKQTRTRWERFQGVRSWLLVIGFILIAVGFSIT